MNDSEKTGDSGDDWDSAMAEQNASDSVSTDTDTEADPWAEAMAEQNSASTSGEATTEPAPTGAETKNGSTVKMAGNDVFKPLDQGENPAATRELEMVMDIPVKLNVELGRTRITIKQLLELTQGSVVELDGLAGDPMDILINDHLIAQGEVVVVDDKYGIRVTDIITPSERAKKLNR